MRPPKVALWGCALLALVWASPAQAAWNNVFQVCCNSCKQRPMISNYPVAAPQANCAPQQNCTTRMIQRSYYQPVTSYRTTYYYEPVTTYKTSYYYEPVTSYRYSSYVDPCTGCCQQVATPCTSYRMREQSCPVTSYLQRSCMQPVTSYQQMNYYVPETTCCNTTIGNAVPGLAPNVGGGVMPPQGMTGEPPVDSRLLPPGTNPNPNLNPNVNPNPNPAPEMEGRLNAPGGGGARFERAYPAPVQPIAPPRATIRLDKTASYDDVSVRGQLVSLSQSPQSQAKVLFVSVEQDRVQTHATTDGHGRFQVQLTEGNWLVYTPGADGRPMFNQKVYVQGSGVRSVLLVNR